jgi:inosine-uridine nucleoside N-ribohydrolase
MHDLSTPVPIVISTDMSIDVDDVGALCVAHALSDVGEARIEAIVHDAGLQNGIAAVASINHFFAREDVPLGAYKGWVGSPEERQEQVEAETTTRPVKPAWTFDGRGPYVDTLVERFFPDGEHLSAFYQPTAVATLRATLAAAAPRSLTFVEIGYATNLVDLLRSGPDGHSDLSGADLVSERVRHLVWAGGSTTPHRNAWSFVACGTGCGTYSGVKQQTSDALRLSPPHGSHAVHSHCIRDCIRRDGWLCRAFDHSSH